MNEKIAQVLEKIGLTKGEVRVYSALINLGETTTGPLIKTSGISGSKVYEILEKLIKKGFATRAIKDNTMVFYPAPAEMIYNFIGKKEEELKESKKNAEKIVPLIKKEIQSKQHPQEAMIFSGLGGIKSLFNKILSDLDSGEEYYAFSLGEENEDKKVIAFLKNHHLKRNIKRIKLKLIASPEYSKQIKQNFNSVKNMKIRYYHNPAPLGVYIFKDNVATVSFKEPKTAFLIKSQRISESYKKFFKSIWKESKSNPARI